MNHTAVVWGIASYSSGGNVSHSVKEGGSNTLTRQRRGHSVCTGINVSDALILLTQEGSVRTTVWLLEKSLKT